MATKTIKSISIDEETQTMLDKLTKEHEIKYPSDSYIIRVAVKKIYDQEYPEE